MTPAAETKLLTFEQAAERLQVSKKFIAAMVRAKKIVCCVISRNRRRITVSDLERYVQECRNVAYPKVRR